MTCYESQHLYRNTHRTHSRADMMIRPRCIKLCEEIPGLGNFFHPILCHAWTEREVRRRCVLPHLRENRELPQQLYSNVGENCHAPNFPGPFFIQDFEEAPNCPSIFSDLLCS